jgi:hypothetical protein
VVVKHHLADVDMAHVRHVEFKGRFGGQIACSGGVGCSCTPLLHQQVNVSTGDAHTVDADVLALTRPDEGQLSLRRRDNSPCIMLMLASLHW